jgi:hypothetical protein
MDRHHGVDSIPTGRYHVHRQPHGRHLGEYNWYVDVHDIVRIIGIVSFSGYRACYGISSGQHYVSLR